MNSNITGNLGKIAGGVVAGVVVARSAKIAFRFENVVNKPTITAKLKQCYEQ